MISKRLGFPNLFFLFIGKKIVSLQKMETIEHSIDSIVEINGKKYKVTVSENATQSICFGCAFYNDNIVKRCNKCADFRCSKFDRSDKTDIFYKEI